MQINYSKIEEFYKQCLSKSNDVETHINLIKAVINSDQLSRFAALLHIEKTTLSHLNNVERQKFTNLKTSINLTNLRQQAFLKKISGLASRAKIPILLLKSTAFNGSIYENDYPRGNSDIDILIKPTDLHRFETLFNTLANKCLTNKSKPYEDLFENTWESKLNRGVFIDVHTSITNPYFTEILTDDLFNSSEIHPLFNNNGLNVGTVIPGHTGHVLKATL